jgi:hypothetical protein
MKFAFRKKAILASLSLIAALATFGCGSSTSALVNQDAALLKASIAESVQQGFSAGSSVARTAGGGGGSLSEESAYFDEFFGLYAMPIADGIDYFLDEARTQPAGQERTTQTVGEAGSFSQTTVLQITGGPRAGYQSTGSLAIDGSRVDLSLIGTDPASGSFETIGFFEGGAGEFSARYTDEQGQQRTFAVRFEESGAYEVASNTGANYLYTLSFAADDSGTGTVTGSNDLLPAQIVWNTEGDGQMTFADGSVLEIRGFDFEQI